MFRSLVAFLRLILERRDVIVSLARRELAKQYIGSVLGFVWTFIHPFILIVVLWVVFSVGFRIRPSNNVPFVVWLTAGLSAWFFFADIVNGSASIVVSNAPLIKKTLFPSQVLPVVKILSALAPHGIFLLVLGGLIIAQGMPIDFFFLQFIYYLFCLCVLALGLGWAFSALTVFIRDVAQIVAVIIQIGFWATPIFWELSIMPARVQFFLKLNPMTYVVQGYRESFIYFVPFWNHPLYTLYFWIVTSAIFFGGAMIFRKLKPQFADVL